MSNYTRKELEACMGWLARVSYLKNTTAVYLPVTTLIIDHMSVLIIVVEAYDLIREKNLTKLVIRA